MNQERLLQVLLAPHITEKATLLAELNNQQVFRVARDATKAEIKAAVEMLFKVDVEGVSVINNKGKAKRFGQIQGKRPSWKKACVTLKQGQSISFESSE